MIKVPTLKVSTKIMGNNCNPLQAWECLFGEDMIEEIVTNTNMKIASHN